jgi:hypothetical protein
MPVPAELAAVSEELPVTDRSRFAGLPGGGATAGSDERDELWAGGRRFAISIISSTEMKGKTWVAGEGTRDTVEAPFMEPTGCLVYGDGPEGGLEGPLRRPR